MLPKPKQPLTLYRHALSGHSHRVELFAALLGLPLVLSDVDLARGAHKAPEFLRLNAFGQVPVLDDAGHVVADSSAILIYLALKYADESWLPRDPAGAAAVQRWLSAAAGPLAYGPAAARLVTVFGAKLDAAEAIARAHGLLAVMEAELGQRSFLAASTPTVADVACYAYVAHAPEGNVSLAAYPQLRAWLGRIEALPGFVPMKASRAGLSAA